MKKCSKCNKIKPSEKFYTQKRYRSSGELYYDLRYICIPCERRHTRERRKVAGFRQSREWKSEKVRQGRGTKHAERSKINAQKHRDEMSDMYIRSLITKRFESLNSEDIPDELVSAYRENLRLKRKLGLTTKLKKVK